MYWLLRNTIPKEESKTQFVVQFLDPSKELNICVSDRCPDQPSLKNKWKFTRSMMLPSMTK